MKSHIKITLMLLSIFLIQCFEFGYIYQPSSTKPNSTFDVAISVKFNAIMGHDIFPLFGILLPNGWSVGDNISSSGSYVVTSNYSKEYSDSMEIVDPAPEGYYWWVCTASKSVADSGTCLFTPQITTDDKTGQFSIRYVIAQQDNIEDRRIEDHRIWVWTEPPKMELTPPYLPENLISGQVSEKTITIANAGYHDLHFSTSAGWKSALQFDGGNDYVECGANILHEFTDWTIEAWILCTGGEYEQSIYSETGTSRGARNIKFMLKNGRLNIYLDTLWENDQHITGSSDLRDSKWHHVAATKKGYLIKLYVDGVNEKEETTARGVDSGLLIRIGFCEADETSSLMGIIDEVRIWNSERTQLEIQADMHRELTGNETGLIGYWQFNEGDGIFAMDLSSNENEGVLHEGPEWITSSAPVLNWLSSSPTAGVIKKDSSLDIAVTFSAENLSAGIYDGIVEIVSNDPLHPSVKLRVHLKVDSATDINDQLAENLPKEFVLSQNYPNPFNPSTVISYQSPAPGHIKLVVYDAIGKEVAVLVDEYKAPGSYEVTFDASGLSSGIYFYKIIAGEFINTKKMVLLQ